jgi:hypothetical protein
MKNEHSSAAAWIVPSLDVLTSSVALYGLFPIAGGLPGIASQGQPIIDGIWFTVNLGGALLLLAGGIKLLLRKARLHLFVLIYAAFISMAGTLRFELVGSQFLVGGWLLMAFCIGGLLLALRSPWLWEIAGAAWCVLLLGAWSVGGIVSFLSIETRQLSFFLLMQVVAFILALVSLILHFRYRAVGGGCR